MRQRSFSVRRLSGCWGTFCLTFLAAGLLGPAGRCPAEDAAEEYSRGALIRFEGEITPWLEQYFYRKLDAAKQSGADLVVVEIESPGGLVEETLRIARRLRDVDWARTVAYVPNRAISGGAIVALGCDEIIMNSEAQMGDAGPIYLNEGFEFRHAPEKFRSYLVSEVRSLAEAKGHPPALAEAMVDMDLIVYPVKDRETGKETFKSDAEIKSDADPDRWEKGNPVHESREDHFLQVDGDRAVELQLARGTADDRDELKTRYGLKDDWLLFEASGVDTAVYILTMPIVTGVLFVIGLVALYVEFSAPGIGAGGLVALLCFLLFFWSRFLGGTADWLDVILFVAGVAFLLVELLVLPGFGVAGLTGILLLLCSLVLACQRHLVPQDAHDWATLTSTLLVILSSGTVFMVAAVVISRHFGTIPILKQLSLVPPASATPGATPKESALQIGSVGVAVSALRPAGKARFGDSYMDVVTDSEFITKGKPVTVMEIHGNRIVVAEPQENA